MSERTTVTQAHEEPDLLRDQFRQLLRYRVPLVAGVALGLVGGAWIGLVGGASYVATSEVTVRSATLDPFAAGSSAPDKQVSIGSERQTAVSNAVADRAAEELDFSGNAERLQSGLQVTNPPNTLVLRFAYTAGSPKTAAVRANAFTEAYLANRRRQTESLIDNMTDSYDQQLVPLQKQRDRLADQIADLGDGRALDSALSVQATTVGKITELNNSIAKLKALDTTPGFVVRTATPPSAPSGPGLPMLLGLGGAVGVGVGLLAAWVRLVFDPTARSDSDVVRALRAPVLGTLPRRRRGRPTGLLAQGRLAEEYRSVAFRLAYDPTFAERRRLLVVAPRGPIDTAAAVSVNLAASFVEMGRDVLLVEADLRSPGLTGRLIAADCVRPAWAASGTALRGEKGWPTGTQIPVDPGESGVFDLVPGTRVRNVARALTSAPATRLVSMADTPGSVVVVLAPAVLSYADAIALTDRVDGVVVVCDPREVRRADLDRVRELITSAGGTVLGAVLHSEGGARHRVEDSRVEDRRDVEAPPHTPAAPEAPRTGRPTRPTAAADDEGPGTLTLRAVDPEALPERSTPR